MYCGLENPQLLLNTIAEKVSGPQDPSVRCFGFNPVLTARRREVSCALSNTSSYWKLFAAYFTFELNFQR